MVAYDGAPSLVVVRGLEDTGSTAAQSIEHIARAAAVVRVLGHAGRERKREDESAVGTVAGLVARTRDAIATTVALLDRVYAWAGERRCDVRSRAVEGVGWNVNTRGRGGAIRGSWGLGVAIDGNNERNREESSFHRSREAKGNSEGRYEVLMSLSWGWECSPVSLGGR
jgi:hypothetical protein